MTEVFLYFLRLGATVFGGVGPQLAAMRRDLVTDRRWLTEEDFARGVALATLCPGPIGSQAAAYCGWRRAGTKGSLAALIAFLLPAFVLIVLLAEANARWSSSPLLARVAAGARCGVIPVIALSCVALWRELLKSRGERAVAAVAAVLCVLSPGDATVIVLAGGALLAMAVRRSDRRGAAAPGLFAVFLVGLQAGALVYGTGQSILPVVREAVVLRRGWITDVQFADALSAGLITPGPIVLAVAYVGHATAGLPGAFAATLGAFLPCWLLVLLVGPWMERVQSWPRAAAFARGATAAAVGGIGAAALGLAGGALVAPAPAALVAAAAAAKLAGTPDPLVVLGGALAGALLF